MSKQIEQARRGLSASELGHVDTAAPERAPGYVLLPGDPNRVEKMAAQWDEGAKLYTLSRRSAAAVGTYKGVELGAWSTGIGGPSAECTLTDLAARGTHTFIRVGTTGAIQEGIRIGDIIINDSNVRLDGTSHLYVRDEYPAAASYEVVLALVQACENLGLRYHVGAGCTCASFYTGQCRTSYGGYRPSHLDADFADLRQAGVLNFEMEGATVTTLSRIFGKRAGMCASVVAQRITGEWDETAEGEYNACLAGAEAVRILTEWDRKKRSRGSDTTSPDCEAAMDEALKKTLIAKAAEVRHNARAFSGFHVGAALLTKSGEIITGCNVELHTTLSSICAERTAMVKAVSMGHTEFTAIAVVSDSDKPVSPCAFCRQYLVDFDPDIQVIMANAAGTDVVEMTASELLPMAFMGSGRDK